MKWRLAVLFGLIFLRLLFNFLVVSSYRLAETARVKFDYYKIERLGTECIMKAGIFWWKGKPVCGLELGSTVRLTGSLRAGLTDRLLGRIWLDGSSSYTTEKVRQTQPSWFERWRAELVKKTLLNLPSPEGELVLGVVMGYKSALPRSFYDELVKSGTVHIVVASGYNVMVVAGLALSVTLLFLKRRLATLVGIALVWFYVLLAGGEVSLLRAALMGSLVLVGLAWGRASRVTWSLMVIVAAMLFVSPTLIENIGFQLSVAATFGVAVVGPWLRQKWGRNDFLELTTTLGALLSTAPLIWWHFGRVSFVSLASNSLILPLVPVLMFLGALTVVLAWSWPALSVVAAWPTYALAHLLVVLIGFFGR